ncbi:MAG: tRNA lysidine(34) synthetase TilS [Pseudomonadota bacterium]|jgi:tRNA(Ile)-lysidine synthase
MAGPGPPEALAQALAAWPPGALRVAASGGLDSTALLHALAAEPAARARGLSAIHVDHGLHPDSARWAAAVRAQAAALSVPLQVQRVQVEAGGAGGLEAAARAARHAAFADALHAGEILVAAHHADDQAETLLLRLLRAAGPEGLRGMRALRPFAAGWLARPWLGLPRDAIRAWAQAERLAWVEDPSNADPRFERNYLRLEVMPRLAARWPHTARALSRSAALLDAAAAREARALDAELARRGAADPDVLDAAGLDALEESARGALLRHWLLSRGLPPPDARALAELGRRLAAPRPDAEPVVRWPGAELRLWRGALYAMAPLPPAPRGWSLDWDGRAPLALPCGGSLRIDGAIATLPLRVAARIGGERIALDARRPSQSVKHLLQSLGVPPWRRARAPLLWHGDALWAVGDWLLAPPLRGWLDARGARYAWTV